MTTTTTKNEYGLITQVVITTDTATIMINNRGYARKGYREWNKLPRFYVWSNEPETIQDNLANRMRRPHMQWKKRLKEVFAEAGIDYDPFTLRWSQYAGCTCPCSPAFIGKNYALSVNGEVVMNTFNRWDMHIEINALPSVDESKLARVLA